MALRRLRGGTGCRKRRYFNIVFIEINYIPGSAYSHLNCLPPVYPIVNDMIVSRFKDTSPLSVVTLSHGYMMVSDV